MSSQPTTRVVVVGGGFGGQHAFRELADAGYDVSLVDAHPYATFQPLLYQVATGGLSPGDVTYPLRRFVIGRREGQTSYRRGTVTGIDRERKLVHVTPGESIPYDRLVLAAGVGPGYFGIPGAAEHTRTIYSRAEALEVRDVIFSGLEELTVTPQSQRRFTVLIVGGGATGVEMAGSLAELKSEGLPVMYPELSLDNFRVVLAEMGPHLLAPFKPRLQRYTLAQLRRRGVDVRLNTAVRTVGPTQVDFADGSTLAVDVTIWASGVAAHPEVAGWDLPTGRGGRLLIDEFLRVHDTTDVYAVGDCAIDPERPLPQLAQPAIQMGRHVGRQIIAEDAGRPLSPFVYDDKGIMATIGRNAAVVEFPNGRTVTGLAAWLLWVGVHMASLLGGRNRVQAMVNTGFRYVTWPQSATNILGDVRKIHD